MRHSISSFFVNVYLNVIRPFIKSFNKINVWKNDCVIDWLENDRICESGWS